MNKTQIIAITVLVAIVLAVGAVIITNRSKSMSTQQANPVVEREVNPISDKTEEEIMPMEKDPDSPPADLEETDDMKELDMIMEDYSNDPKLEDLSELEE